MRMIDISFPIEEGMASFPGDPKVVVRKVRSIDDGDPYELSELSMGSHTGTHVDAPSHFLRGGASVDQLDLSLLNGPCYVLRVPSGVEEVGAEDVARIPEGTTRVLFRTRNSELWERSNAYFPGFAALGMEAAGSLLARGVRLVGIDSLSVEHDRSETYPIHRALLISGAVILEGLRLGQAPEGRYELRCLPLRIASGDAGPCRALLLEA